MRKPRTPPPFHALVAGFSDPARIKKVMSLGSNPMVFRHYLHWDKIRVTTMPDGVTPEDLWLAAKIQRRAALKSVPLLDKTGKRFEFCVPELVLEALHRIDMGAGAAIGVPEPITNPQTRDQYLLKSLMEEAITSSQLEGAATTREVAREMIRTGRKPRDKDEQMILNNFVTMQLINEWKNEPLSPEMVFDIHRHVTEHTLKDESAAGRFRKPEEKIDVGDDITGEVYHDPPNAVELRDRLDLMCDFANGKTPGFFVHPVIRSIILHFWLAYDHPFVDGNGRTARALFYWSMLRSGYWLFEFISISTILRKAPIKYGRSFLYTETDDNDLTYFIIAQTKVINRAIEELHAYIERKVLESRELEVRVRALDLFNHRQVALIRHAIKHPQHRYTIEGHRKSHNIVYQTARTDLLDLVQRKILDQKTLGRRMEFIAPSNLAARLAKLGK
jgi:Fic family protein